MQFNDYIYRDSIVHNLDPRTKIAWFLGISFLAFVLQGRAAIAGLLLLVVLAVIISKLPVKSVWDASKWFMLLFTLANIVLFSLLLWNLENGLVDTVFFSMRFYILVIVSSIFSMSTSPRDVLLAFTKLKVPYQFAFMLSVAMRFVPVITREFYHVIDAQKTRGHVLRISLLHPVESLKTASPVFIPTFNLLLTKAFDLSLSVEARGFKPGKRSAYRMLKLRVKDYLAVAILVLMIAATAAWGL